MDVSLLALAGKRALARRQQAQRKRQLPRRAAANALAALFSNEISVSVSDVLILSERPQAQGGALATSRYRR